MKELGTSRRGGRLCLVRSSGVVRKLLVAISFVLLLLCVGGVVYSHRYEETLLQKTLSDMRHREIPAVSNSVHISATTTTATGGADDTKDNTKDNLLFVLRKGTVIAKRLAVGVPSSASEERSNAAFPVWRGEWTPNNQQALLQAQKQLQHQQQQRWSMFRNDRPRSAATVLPSDQDHPPPPPPLVDIRSYRNMSLLKALLKAHVREKKQQWAVLTSRGWVQTMPQEEDHHHGGGDVRRPLCDVVDFNDRGSSNLSSLPYRESNSCEWNAPQGSSTHAKRPSSSLSLWHIPAKNEEILLRRGSDIPHRVAVYITDVDSSSVGDPLRMIEYTTVGFTSWFVNPLECLRHAQKTNKHVVDTSSTAAPLTNIIFFGHSHNRVLAAMLCMMWHLPHCDVFKKKIDQTQLERETIVSERRAGEGSHTTKDITLPSMKLQFVTSLYDLRQRMGYVTMALKDAVSPPKEEDVLVVYNRGPWDLVYTDTPIATYIKEVSEGLLALHKVLQGEAGEATPAAAAVVVYLQHYTQPKWKSSSAWQLELRNVCMSRQRVLRLRNATICAIRRALAHDATMWSRLRLFDVWAETSALPDSMDRFVDYGGHHYSDIVLETLAMKFLRQHVCPIGVDAWNRTQSSVEVLKRYVDSVSDDTCAFLEHTTFPRVDGCGCRGLHRNNAVCTRFENEGKRAPPSRRRVARLGSA